MALYLPDPEDYKGAPLWLWLLLAAALIWFLITLYMLIQTL